MGAHQLDSSQGPGIKNKNNKKLKIMKFRLKAAINPIKDIIN